MESLELEVQLLTYQIQYLGIKLRYSRRAVCVILPLKFFYALVFVCVCVYVHMHMCYVWRLEVGSLTRPRAHK